MSECIASKDVRLRKARKCFGCLKFMECGDSARVETCKEDGKIYDIYLCLDCKKKVESMQYDDEFCEGDLKESPNEF